MTQYIVTEQFFFNSNGIDYAAAFDPTIDMSIHETTDGAMAAMNERAEKARMLNYMKTNAEGLETGAVIEMTNPNGNRRVITMTEMNVEE